MRAAGSRLYLLNPLRNVRQRCQVCVSDNALGVRLPGCFQPPTRRARGGWQRQAGGAVVPVAALGAEGEALLLPCASAAALGDGARTDPASPSRRCSATSVVSLVKCSFGLHGPAGSLFFFPVSLWNFRAMRCSYFSPSYILT